MECQGGEGDTLNDAWGRGKEGSAIHGGGGLGEGTIHRVLCYVHVVIPEKCLWIV